MSSSTIGQLIDGCFERESFLEYVNSENMLNDLNTLEGMKNDQNSCNLIIAYFKSTIGSFSQKDDLINTLQKPFPLISSLLALLHLILDVLMKFPKATFQMTDELVIKDLFFILCKSIDGAVLFCKERNVCRLVISVLAILYRMLSSNLHLRSTYRRAYPLVMQLLVSCLSGSDIIYNNSSQYKLFVNSDHYVILMLLLLLLTLLADESENHVIHSSDVHIKHLLYMLDHYIESPDSFIHKYRVDSLDFLTGLIYAAGPDTNKSLLVKNGILHSISYLLQNSSILSFDTHGEALTCKILELFWSLCCIPNVSENSAHLAEAVKLCLLLRHAPWSNSCKIKLDAIVRSVFLPYLDITGKSNIINLHPHAPRHFDVQFCYHGSYKPLIEKVNHSLLELGYQSRIYVNCDAIEANLCDVAGASCVLVGVCNALKSSPRCRQEIRYASSRRIPLLPVILERDFKLDGWLGFMLSTLIYVSFATDDSDTDYNQNLMKLTHQLDKIFQRKTFPVAEGRSGSCSITSDIDTKLNTPTSSASSNPLIEWLSAQGLASYREAFARHSGDVLKKMIYLRKHVPANFLRELRYDVGMPLADQLRLLRGLTRLGGIN